MKELKRYSKGGRFGLLKWRQETKENGIVLVRFYNLIMVELDYFESVEYQDTFQLRLAKQSSDLTKLFLLQLKLSCRRLLVYDFGEELLKEILESLGYLSHITCLFVIKLNLPIAKGIVFVVLLICQALYLVFLYVRDVQVFRLLLSLLRTVLIASRNLQKWLFKRNVFIK